MPVISVLFCFVVGISDGDTLTARCGEPGAYEQLKVRISAIDAPEKKQAWGQRSRQHLADLCFQQQAKITTRSRDRYGRTVADVECQGQDAGTAQVRAGMAWVYTKYAVGRTDLEKLQATANAEGRGLWSQEAVRRGSGGRQPNRPLGIDTDFYCMALLHREC